MIIEVFDETDSFATNAWFGTFECPHHVNNLSRACAQVYFNGWELIAHIQTYHPHVDLDPLPLSELFAQLTGDTDLANE